MSIKMVHGYTTHDGRHVGTYPRHARPKAKKIIIDKKPFVRGGSKLFPMHNEYNERLGFSRTPRLRIKKV